MMQPPDGPEKPSRTTRIVIVVALVLFGLGLAVLAGVMALGQRGTGDALAGLAEMLAPAAPITPTCLTQADIDAVIEAALLELEESALHLEVDEFDESAQHLENAGDKFVWIANEYDRGRQRALLFSVARSFRRAVKDTRAQDFDASGDHLHDVEADLAELARLPKVRHCVPETLAPRHS